MSSRNAQPSPPSPKTLAQLAEAMNGRVVGDATVTVSQVAHPRFVTSDRDLILIIDPEAIPAVHHPMVKAAVVAEGIVVPEGALTGYVVVERPRYALAKLLDIFDKPLHIRSGVHPTAVIEESAVLDPSVSVGPLAYVGEKAVIGKNTVIMPQVTVGAEVQIGEDCLLHPGVRLGERVVLGNRVMIQHNASIGADGFSYVTPEAGSVESAKATGKVEAQNTEIVRINSVGTVILEDDVEVGACATIDRSNLGATLVKKGTKVDNLVMIGHNNVIGENCLIVSQVGISGSCNIGDRVVIAGQAGLKDHLKVGDDAIITAKAGVMFDVEAKSVVAGAPALPQREFFQNIAYLTRMKDMHKDLRDLKKRVQQLEAELAGCEKELVEG